MANTGSRLANKRRSSLNSGLDVLELLARQRVGTNLTEIASAIGMSKSGVHSLLATLSERGFIERDDYGAYHLGLRAWEIGCGVPQLDVSRLAAPYMSELVRTVSEGAILGILTGHDVIYAHLIESPQPVRVHAELGDRIPAHWTSTGLALLAALPDDEVRALLPERLAAKTSQTITDIEQLLRELQRVRARGYSINRGGWRLDVGGVAAAVLAQDGRPIAAVCVAVPIYRMTKAWLATVCPALMICVDRIGKAVRTAPQVARGYVA
jgi:DNA-binding IclR family transcriptional regulator